MKTLINLLKKILIYQNLILQYRFKKDNVHNDYLINIFGHNSQNFDQSFLIRALQNLDCRIPFSFLPFLKINGPI